VSLSSRRIPHHRLPNCIKIQQAVFNSQSHPINQSNWLNSSPEPNLLPAHGFRCCDTHIVPSGTILARELDMEIG
jgi:hypothetical protein